SCPRRTCRPCGAGTSAGAVPAACLYLSYRCCGRGRPSVLVRMASLGLHPIKAVVFQVVALHRPAFARLALRRQAALHTATLRFGLALGARPIDDLLLFVDANDQVA